MQVKLKKMLSIALAVFVVSLSTYTGVNDREINARTLVPTQADVQMELSEETNSSESQLSKGIEFLNKKSLVRPVYGQDEKILDLLQAELVEEGLTDLSLSLASSAEEAYASIDLDGNLNYFYVDPSENISKANTGFENIRISIVVHEGENEETTEPITVQLNWDESKVEEYFERKILSNFDFMELINPNTDAEEVLEGFKLPRYTEGKDFIISWTSDNNATEIGNLSTEYQNGEFVQFYPVNVKQGSDAESVTLIASFKFNHGRSDINYDRTYDLVVPGIDLSEIEAEMQNDIDQYFNEHVLKYSYPNADVEFHVDNVLHDIQLPASSFIRRNTTDENGEVISKGITDLFQKYVTSGAGFSFYEVKNLGEVEPAGIVREGFRVAVTLPADGEKPVKAELTMTLQHKEYDLAVSKTIVLTLNPTDYDALMTQVSRKAQLMDLVKANFFDIINSNPAKIGSDQARQNTSADKIEYDLSQFAEVRFKNPEDPNDNTLEYIYNQADKVGDGVSLATLPNWEMQESWRLLKSSNPRYIAHESLRVNKPEYNEDAIIEAMLTVPSMEQYKDYFSADNTSEDSKKLASLFDQTITQEVVIIGENGEAPENNEDDFIVNLLVLGSDIIDSDITEVEDYNTWLDTSMSVAKDSLIKDFVSLALAQSENVEADIYDGFINSIEVPGYAENVTAETNGARSSWMWYVKSADSDEFTLIDSLLPKDEVAYLNPGDTILLFFQNDYTNFLDPNLVLNSEETPVPTPTPPTEENVESKPGESVDYDVVPSDWPSFRGNDNNNAVITAGPLSPNSSETVELSYAKPFASGWVSPNQALVINDELVFIVDDVLYALNQETGDVIRELQMPAGIGFANTAALYASGRIFIPLDGSRLVSFPYANWTNQTDLASISGARSFKDSAGNGSQVQTQLAYHEGKVILPLVNGPLIVLNSEDGSLEWRKDIDGGFYNAGGIISENHYISGTDNGELLVIDLATGETKSTTKLGDQIRSSVVRDGDDYYIVANTGDSSKLFKFQVIYAGGQPTVSIAYEVSIPAGVTTPVIVNNGRVYVTNKSDTVYIVNSATGAIIRNVTYPNEFLGIQGAPLLVEDGHTSYVYFTVNDEHGRVMFFEDNHSMTENSEAKVLYQADEDLREYSRNAIIPGSDGRLFFSLDNGYIFSLVGKEATVTPEPEPVDTTELEASIATAVALVETDYTAESYELLSLALAEAQVVLANVDVTQAEVDAAQVSLQATIDALVAVEPTEPSTTTSPEEPAETTEETTEETTAVPAETTTETPSTTTTQATTSEDLTSTGEGVSYLVLPIVTLSFAVLLTIYRRKRVD